MEGGGGRGRGDNTQEGEGRSIIHEGKKGEGRVGNTQ